MLLNFTTSESAFLNFASTDIKSIEDLLVNSLNDKIDENLLQKAFLDYSITHSVFPFCCPNVRRNNKNNMRYDKLLAFLKDNSVVPDFSEIIDEFQRFRAIRNLFYYAKVN